MLKIGVTGGIGSGKSEVSKFFQTWGAYIFDADKEAKAKAKHSLTSSLA